MTHMPPMEMASKMASMASAAALLTALACASAHAAPPTAPRGAFGTARADYSHVVTPGSGQSTLDRRHLDPHTPLATFEFEAALGTRGLGLPGLGTYLLGELHQDLDGGPPAGAALGWPRLTDGRDDGRLIALHLAYGELDGFTTTGALSRLHLRAGRQFHWGLVPVTFDGGSVGYDGDDLALGLRVGRRAAVYAGPTDDDGLLAGADASVVIGGRRGLRLRAEYLLYHRTLTLVGQDARFVEAETVEDTLHLGRLAARYTPDRALAAGLAATLAAGELGHLDADLRYAAGPFALQVDARQKVGRDLVYDLALGLSHHHRGHPTTHETLRLNLPEPGPYTRVDLTAEWALGPELFIVPELGGRHTWADPAERTLYDVDHLRWALGVHGAAPLGPADGLELRLRYEGTTWGEARDTGYFAGPTAGGERGAHGVDAELRYTRGTRRIGGRLLAGRSLDVGVRAGLDHWTLRSRYGPDRTDLAYGAGLDGRVAIGEHLALRASYQFTKDTTYTRRWLDPLHGARIGVDGIF